MSLVCISRVKLKNSKHTNLKTQNAVPNICTTYYVIEGEKKELDALYETMTSLWLGMRGVGLCLLLWRGAVGVSQRS